MAMYSKAGPISSFGVYNISNSLDPNARRKNVLRVPQRSAKERASETHCDFFAASPRSCARDTIAVVDTVKNWNTIETNPKTAVFGPSAASPIELTCPTQAVSTRLISGSASTAPNAGNEKLSTRDNARGGTCGLDEDDSVSGNGKGTWGSRERRVRPVRTSAFIGFVPRAPDQPTVASSR
jgi:hypothetical protein